MPRDDPTTRPSVPMAIRSNTPTGIDRVQAPPRPRLRPPPKPVPPVTPVRIMGATVGFPIRQLSEEQEREHPRLDSDRPEDSVTLSDLQVPEWLLHKHPELARSEEAFFRELALRTANSLKKERLLAADREKKNDSAHEHLARKIDSGQHLTTRLQIVIGAIVAITVAAFGWCSVREQSTTARAIQQAAAVGSVR